MSRRDEITQIAVEHMPLGEQIVVVLAVDAPDRIGDASVGVGAQVIDIGVRRTREPGSGTTDTRVFDGVDTAIDA
jgi:5,10-methylene-tetrahydrofolate dehydrogenase/methenyl tetrahydrofolate cyclohydrolase